MFQARGLGHWRHQLETDRFWCSEGLKAILGLAPDEEVTSFDQVLARLHPDERLVAETARQRALSGTDFEFEHRFMTRDGRTRWVMGRGSVLRDPQVGSVLAGVAIDITAQKEAEAERERLIAELAAERCRVRALVSHMPAAVLVADASGRIVLANPAVETIFPMAPPRLPTTSDELFASWQAEHADGRVVEAHERPLSRALRGETVEGEDFAYLRPDGTKNWIRIGSAPIRDDDANVTGAVAIAGPIDREKRAEKALRASERRHRQLFDSPVIGVIHSHVDGRITDANDKFLEMVGYTREDLEEGRLSWREMTPPEWREEDERGVEELRASGSHHVFEKEYIRKDGTRVPIVLGGTMIGGSTTEIATFVLDISDRKRVEAERESLHRSLAQSEERYRLAAMASDDEIYDWNLATNRVHYPAVFGDSPKIGDAACWAQRLHPQDRDGVLAGLRSALTSPSRQWRSEYRFRAANGDWLTVEDRGYVVCDDGGKPVRLVGAMHDVTARRRQQEFERQLIGIVSHDLRNPLATILLGAEMMARSDETGPRTLKNAQRIQSAAERALRLVRDLLDFTRARLGVGIAVERRPTDLIALVRKLVDEIRLTHRSRRIVFASSGDCNGTFDADRLSQVVTNLIENALKYSPETSDVEVTLDGSDDKVVLAVHNGGAPISAELLPRIFEPLQRGDAASDPASRSVGLGLYIVKHLVEAHGGHIEVDSAEGRGTTFKIELPRA